MGSTFGRTVLQKTGRNIAVSADGKPQWKSVGITIDWSTVAAVNTDTSLADGVVIPNGQKGLRYGQILTKITQREIQTVTIDATGGTFTISGVKPDGTTAFTTAALAWNASAATVQAALNAAAGTTNAFNVALATLVYTITFQNDYDEQNVAQLTTDASSLTGGAGTAAVATGTQGSTSYGMYGPYDPSATDGRQTLSRSSCYILNETVLESFPLGLGVPSPPSNHPAVFDGGKVWKERLLITTGTHSLAAGPTVTEFEAAFPRISYVQ